MAGRWRKGGRLVEVVGAGHSEMDDWEGLGAVTWHVCPPWRGRPARRGLLERPGAAGGSTPPFLYTLHSSHASPSPITPAQRLTGFHLSSHCHYTASFTVTPLKFPQFQHEPLCLAALPHALRSILCDMFSCGA